MNRFPKQRLFLLGAVSLIAWFCAVWAAGPGHRQLSEAFAADQPATGAAPGRATAMDDKPAYNGSAGCQLCHRQFEGRTFTIRMTESDTWRMHDRHSKAYALLKDDRGKAMGERLKSLGYQDITTDQRCLSCHCDWQTARGPHADTNSLVDGVACEACHGASSKYYLDHTLPKWREVSLTDRSSHYGMLNVRDPQVRAEICLSCHVGNAEQGKVVTHDMYAAGHPPLPSFELGDFCQLMPPHWDEFHDQLKKFEKDANTRKYLEDLQQQLGQDDSTLPGLKSVLIGAVMEMQQSVKLVADQAAGKVRHVGDAQNSDNQSAVWPEFALYDCTMCHHELQSPGWRQSRTTQAPGRPLIPRWPQTLVGVAIDQISADRTAAGQKKKQFAKLLDDLDEPFRRQPFADPADIAAPAQKLTDFLDHEVLGPLNSSKFDQRAAAAALGQLCTAATEKVVDYDSARQLGWAFDRIYNEFKRATTGGGQANPAAKTIDDELTALKGELRLELNSLGSAPVDVQAAFSSASKYMPQHFQQHFKTIADALGRVQK